MKHLPLLFAVGVLSAAAKYATSERVRCTPAIPGNRIYVCGADHLRAFGQ
jgi:hypothetical protein